MDTRAFVIIALLALISTACFFEPPVPGPSDATVTLTADPASIGIGSTSEITLETDAELDCGLEGCTGAYPTIVLEGERETVTPPATVDSLNVLERISGSLRVIDAPSAELSVRTGALEAIREGSATLALDDGLVLVTGAQAVEVDDGSSVELIDGSVLELLSTQRAPPENPSLETATFTVENVDDETDVQNVTVTNGEPVTLELGDNSATADIIDVTMSNGELETLTLRVVPDGALGALYTKELDFSFETGKRIDLGATGMYDVFLEDVTYAQGTEILSAELSIGSQTATLERGSSVLVSDRLVAFAGLSTFVVGSNGVLVTNDGTVQVQDGDTWVDAASGSYEQTDSDYLVRITDSGSDSVFGTYSLTNMGDEVMVSDTLSAVEIMADATTVTAYRFNLPGSYTFTGTVRENGDVLGEDSATVVVG